MTRPAVFLDRDNTINYDPGYLSDPAQVRLLPGAAEGLALLRDAGLPLVLISNQAGVGRGYFSREVLGQVHDRLVELLAAHGIVLAGVYYCLHAPSEACGCRKPEPGMILQAARELELDPAASFMIGDKASDVLAGRRAGCRTVLIGDPEQIVPDGAADVVCSDLLAAARWILERLQVSQVR